MLALIITNSYLVYAHGYSNKFIKRYFSRRQYGCKKFIKMLVVKGERGSALFVKKSEFWTHFVNDYVLTNHLTSYPFSGCLNFFPTT